MRLGGSVDALAAHKRNLRAARWPEPLRQVWRRRCGSAVDKRSGLHAVGADVEAVRGGACAADGTSRRRDRLVAHGLDRAALPLSGSWSGDYLGAVFEDWKRAWREAVENFRRELNEPESASGPGARVRAMDREIHAARDALRRLDAAIDEATSEALAERESERVCRRREKLADGVRDDETVRLAAEYAERHAERAGVLERKAAVLREERSLLGRDLEAMQRVFDAQPKPVEAAPNLHVIDEERERQTRDFSRLEREARERAAAERLEELKRKLR